MALGLEPSAALRTRAFRERRRSRGFTLIERLVVIAMNHSLADALCQVSLVAALSAFIGAEGNTMLACQPPSDDRPGPGPRASSGTNAGQQSFLGAEVGEDREVGGVKLCWCPPGRFTMGSPPGEPERRPGEDQVEVTLSRGFWVGKYEVTQGQWEKVVGEFPGKLTAGEGDDFPVYDINFAEAEGF
jgi:formylglycine-generating enzyme required for sulfatase activity